LAVVATDVIGDVVTAGLPGLADVVSINLPFDASAETPRQVTTVARVGYDRLFTSDGNGVYHHDFNGELLEFEPLDGTDIEAGRGDRISIAPIQMPTAASVPEDVRSRIER
jgi:broad specificity polyphosphatase/5'/3'-nucleotidase SurE